MFQKKYGYLLAGSIVLLFSGCSTASDENTLTWVTGSDSSPDAPDEEMSAYVQDNISDIENEYGYTMQHSIHTSNIDEAMARLQEQATRGQAPDFALIDGMRLNDLKNTYSLRRINGRV
ncbi:hypothetical protein JCM19046_3095 [Bacillus sp. JCM 19046]|nr:hypothetical protein JCM19046_3095 [Bacillus sp. JCM 19046]